MGDYQSVTFSSEESAAVRTAIVDARSKGEDTKAAAQRVLNPSTDAPVTSAPPAAAEPAKILGKFSTQADLEKAYKELESKLGAQKAQPNPKTEPKVEAKSAEIVPPKEGEVKPPEGQEQASEALAEVGLDLNTFSEEFASKGTLSEDSYKALESKGIPKAIVDSYIAGQQAQAAMAEQALMTEAGFKDTGKFSEAVAWAATNWEPKALESYNKAVATNNPDAVKLALSNLRVAHEHSMGDEPSLKTGSTGSQNDSDVFKDRQEMVEMMKSKEYKNSQSYRDKVTAKLARSNIW